MSSSSQIEIEFFDDLTKYNKSSWNKIESQSQTARNSQIAFF